VGSGELDGDQTKVEGHNLRPACLTFIDGVATVEVLQWWRRLDLAESGEL
jgi:hypothetical protein